MREIDAPCCPGEDIAVKTSKVWQKGESSRREICERGFVSRRNSRCVSTLQY